jgi:pimeloyl-ACP methyl ester carboxylesterase
MFSLTEKLQHTLVTVVETSQMTTTPQNATPHRPPAPVVPAVHHHRRVGPYATHLVTWGDPDLEPVLLLHDGAFGGSAEVSWSAVGPLLARDNFVIAPDMLGFGQTDKAVILGASPYDFRIAHLTAVLADLGISRPVHVIGNSFGGSVALRALADDNALGARSVCAVNGTGGPWRTPLALSELSRWDGTRDDLERIVRLLMLDGPHLQGHLDRRLDAARQPGHYRAMKAPAAAMPEVLRSITAVDDPWPQQLASTRTPVLLIAGAEDELLKPGWTTNLDAVLTNCTSVTMPGRHAPNVDDAEGLLAIVGPFLRSV